MKNFGFQISIFLWKIFHDFPKFFEKSLINKIENIKISRLFWQLQIDKIENKLSKIKK